MLAPWKRIGRPDPFTVVDAGAGAGTLARLVAAAQPEGAGAMRYVAVEVSSDPAPRVASQVISETCRRVNGDRCGEQ